jgi:hypothetical protein
MAPCTFGFVGPTIRVWCKGCAAALGADDEGSSPSSLTNGTPSGVRSFRLWLSLVEQALRECEVEGSNPSSLTIT